MGPAHSLEEAAKATHPRLHRIDPRDDVAVALVPLAAGERLMLGEVPVTATVAVPAGHKVALRAVPAGAAVHKFGHPIGRASRAIAPGEHVHVHNLQGGETADDTAALEDPAARGSMARPGLGGFSGYARADGRVGTRNEIWILCTTGACRIAAERIARIAAERVEGRVDGVFAFDAIDSSPMPDAAARRFLASLAGHPNAGGVLLLGLHRPAVAPLLAVLPGGDAARIRCLGLQEAGDAVAAGVAMVDDLAVLAGKDRRTKQSMNALVVGLKCGATDGFSAITGNALLGRVADRVVDGGGAVLLSELPEIMAAESWLAARAATPDVAGRLREIVAAYRQDFESHGLPPPGRPNPGNVAGGVTTLAEKALGALQKAGHAPLRAVLRYGECMTGRGFAVVEAPGTDEISTAALAAAGANLILFSTGKGTPLGAPVPTVKIASRSSLAADKPTWIDFDAGMLLSGAAMDDAVLSGLLDVVSDTASGRPCRAEVNGARELAFWKRGPTL